MYCQTCKHENPAGNRFCGGCGSPLTRSCPECEHPNPPDHRFCGACGTNLDREPVADGVARSRPAASPTGARKVVSIVFADLVGSTSLHERLDAEAVRQFMESYYAAMRGAVEAHGGRVTQLMGDGVKAVFGAPRVAEDDAIRAVRAAVEMQRAFRALAEQQQGRVGQTGLRVAVNTGEVVAEEGQEIIGDPVNVAARLQEQGRDGDVVIGGSTQRLVAALVTLDRLGSFALKGRSEQVEAYRVVSLEPPAGAATAAFVGRDDELFKLNVAFESAVDNAATVLAVLVASPGLGKSRLIAEFTRRLDDTAFVLTAHCDAAGGASFAPLADALQEHFGPTPADVEAAVADALAGSSEAERTRIVAGIAALLSGSPGSPEETFFVIRRLLAALAAAKPVVLVIDDLHWGEPLLLDLVEHLVQWGSGVPLLVLVGARPELRDLRSSLLTPGGFVSDVLTLGGLDAGAATRLAASVIGAADLPAAIAARVLATSEGNPLFVSELVRMLVQEGALTREGERWTAGAGLTEIEMPPTIHALLAARIERLRPEESVVLERAAVVGRHFSRSTLAALLPDEIADLDARLESLRRSELIERDSGWLFGEPVLRFHHVLIRDAAYRRLLKGTRAELHERFANWLEAHVGDAAEHDETIGYHLEQAHQLLRELGPLDGDSATLGERAARRLATAGRRALNRDDVTLAASLLGRAIDRLDANDPTRAELTLDWCEALLSAGDVATAAEAIANLNDFLSSPTPHTAAPDALQRLRAWHTCFAGQLTVLTSPQELQATAAALAAAADRLAALGDEAGEAKAHSVHAQALARLGRVGACEAALDKALAAARKAGDRRRANAVLAGAPLAALWGPSPVTRASGRCLDVVRVLRITQGAPAVEAVALSCQGVLEALRGRTEAARRMIASSRKMVEELGIAHRLLETDVFAARIDLIEGDPATAERTLTRAYPALRELGFGIDAARAAALLGRALLEQGRAAEAEALSHESEQLAGDDLQSAIAWRGVRAEATARRGEHAAAIELAREAVEIATATDALLDHADARLALAAALRAAGRPGDADAEERRAIELWQAKGATLLCERARDVAPAAAAAQQSSPEFVRPARRVRLNRASANTARFCAAMEARDEAALIAVYSPAATIIHHPTGTTYGVAETVEGFRPAFAARRLVVADELLATLGDSLALVRRGGFHEGIDSELGEIGRADLERCVVTEVDARGLARHVEVFDIGHLGDAVVCLYERYAQSLPEGEERDRAVSIARSGRALLNMADLERLAPVLAPDMQSMDHRNVGYGTLHGAAEALEGLRALIALSQDISWRTEDTLALTPDLLLVRATTSGAERTGGGRFERETLTLIGFDREGLIAHWEQFDVDEHAAALERFDELANPEQKSSFARRPDEIEAGFSNTATRAMQRLQQLWLARDWEAAASALPADFRIQDRRRLVRLDLDRDGYIDYLRQLGDMSTTSLDLEPIATRGDRFALCRTHIRVAGEDLGPSELSNLTLVETNERGEAIAMIRFDDEDEDAARQEMDRLYRESDAGPAYRVAVEFARTVNERDWDGLARLCSPNFVNRDNRPFSVLGTVQDAALWVKRIEALVALAPDTSIRFDHLREAPKLAVWQVVWAGAYEGGNYEIPMSGYSEIDQRGLMSVVEIYDPEQIDLVLRHVESPAQTPPGNEPDEAATEIWSNAATRLNERFAAATAAGDLDALAALHAPSHHYDDRRRLMQMRTPLDMSLEGFRVLLDSPHSRIAVTPLATRGDRYALSRGVLEGQVGDGGGQLAIEYLAVDELDESGRFAETVLFDPDDLEAAYAELDERWQAAADTPGRTVAELMRRHQEALKARDWAGVAACYSPDLVGYDHRLVGWGAIQGPDSLIRTLQAMIDLAPDAEMRALHLRASESGQIIDAVWVGTRDGGVFESPFVSVLEIDTAGRGCRVDFYDPNHAEQALERFRRLESGSRWDLPPSIAKPNRAVMGFERWKKAFNSGDRDAMRATVAPAARWEDRRRMVQLSGSGELMLASNRERLHARAQAYGELLGTAGDRIAVFRLLMTGGATDGRFEIESVDVVEVDESGRTAAVIQFDPEDALEAKREAWRRWAALEPELAPTLAELQSANEALNAQDQARFRALLADDIVVEDHRRTGVGHIEGGDAYADAVATLWALAPSTQMEIGWFWLAISPRGGVYTLSRSGNIEGGGPFESDYLMLALISAQQVTRFEIFELEDLDVALARFEELTGSPDKPATAGDRDATRVAGQTPSPPSTPDLLRIPPNRTTRVIDRLWRLAQASAWDELAAICSSSLVFEDRRRGLRTSGDRDTYIASLRVSAAPGVALSRTLLAAPHERLALERRCWTSAEDVTLFEIECLTLTEIDAEGRIVAAILFDVDADAAAHRALADRAMRLDEGEMAPDFARLVRALAERDVAGVRAAIPDDFVYDDRRRIGLGRIEGADAYIESLSALFELTPDGRINSLYRVANAPTGHLSMARVSGVNLEGGAFETVYLILLNLRDDRVASIEIFDADDLASAKARFDELHRAPPPDRAGAPARLRIPPNAATRALDEIGRIMATGGKDALAAFVADDFEFDDRKRRSLVRGGSETWVRALDFMVSEAAARPTAELVATSGDRLALHRVRWREESDDSRFEIESYRVTEVDEAGRLRALVLFDLEDRIAAHEEMVDRYEAGGADGAAPALLEVARAWNDHDLDRMRDHLPADFYLEDRRRTGVGRIVGADAYLASVAAMYDLSPDLRLEPVCTLAITEHGRVYINRWYGTDTEGGEFESVYVVIALASKDRPVGLEIFELEDLDRALARLDEFAAEARR